MLVICRLLLVFVFFSFSSSTFAADNSAGLVLVVKGSAKATDRNNAQTRPLMRQAEIFEQDIIETSKNGFVIIRFSDNSRVTVRPNSTLEIEKYRFNSDEKAATLHLMRGGLRVISGQLAKTPKNFKLRTKVASMGVRGTQFDARICTGDCGSEELTLPASGATDPECKDPLQGYPPGLYATPYKHQIYMEKDGQVRDLKPGQAQYANESEMRCMNKVPRFLADDPTPFGDELGDLAAGSCGFGLGSGSGSGTGLDSRHADDIAEFLNEGYDPTTVFLHGTAMGMTVDQLLFWSIQANPSGAEEYYDKMIDLLPSLPGYACPSGGRNAAYSPTYHYLELPPPANIEVVASKFFKEDERMVPFPNWIKGRYHMLTPATDLNTLDQESYWYLPSQKPPVTGDPGDSPIFVSLYADKDQIVHDWNGRANGPAQPPGKEKLPVVFLYNQEYQVPVSRYGVDVDLKTLFSEFFDKNIELSPVRNIDWGDHHLVASFEELGEYFEIPELNTISKERYERLKSELSKDSFNRKPVMITLLVGGTKSDNNNDNYLDGRGWLNHICTRSSRSTLFPTILFYNVLGREQCGAAASCTDIICKAAMCAGAKPSVCNKRPGFQRTRPFSMPILLPPSPS
ncbi:FecR domain-containing protein [Pseudomonadota bacterium]